MRPIADEQRFAVRLFVSCQALGMHEEMRRIVERLWMGGGAQSPVVDYLKAQVLTAEKRYSEALAALERVTEADWCGRPVPADRRSVSAPGPLARRAAGLRKGAGDRSR